MKENHSLHAKETDLPIAGLLTDLKAHGLLDETLVSGTPNSAACLSQRMA